MSRVLAAALCAVIVSVFTSSSFAVTYNEFIDGDLSVSSFPLKTLNLDAGNNTVTGQMSITAPDLDAFAFVVPSGYSITDLSVNFSNAVDNITSATMRIYSGSADPASGLQLFAVPLATVPGTTSLIPAPLDAGTYHLDTIGLVSPQSGGPFVGGFANYTFTLNVIPEPGSLSLIGLASLGLLVRKRR